MRNTNEIRAMIHRLEDATECMVNELGTIPALAEVINRNLAMVIALRWATGEDTMQVLG